MTQQFDAQKQKVLEEADTLYHAGLELFQSGDIKGAEESFVSAVRPFLSKNTMRNIYVKVEDFAPALLDLMYHMGMIYLDYGRINNTGYNDHFSSAAAIFQYCHAFKEKYQVSPEFDSGKRDYLREAYLAEENFLSSVGVDIASIEETREEYYRSKLEKYKVYNSQFTGIRRIVGQGLEEITDLGMDSIGYRVDAVKVLYKRSTDFFVNGNGDGLVQRLLSECQEKLGPAPCTYAVVGLGSLAHGTMTPWSDLEFAILTENDDYKNSKNTNPTEQLREKEYFRNLTKLLHIKVINFGETPLRSVGIESFNNFKTGEIGDDWFWDECINSGFSFDGPHWHACKTPLGRQEGYKVIAKAENIETEKEEKTTITKPNFELILTPAKLAELQLTRNQEEESGTDGLLDIVCFESDPHLLQSLRSTILITSSIRIEGYLSGSQNLLDEYRSIVKEIDYSQPSNTKIKSLKVLTENIEEFQIQLGDEDDGKIFDIKKSVYRIADRIITELANYYGIMPKPRESGHTSWEIIDRMASYDNPYNKTLLSTEGAKHLREALSIATELRLATYSHNQGQIESIMTYIPDVGHLSQEEQRHLIESTFHLNDTSILVHFFKIAFSLQNILIASSNNYQLFETTAINELAENTLYDNSNFANGFIHKKLLKYQEAMIYLESAKLESQNDEEYFKITVSLQSLCKHLGHVARQISLNEELLSVTISQDFEEGPNLTIAKLYYDLSSINNNLGRWGNAIGIGHEAISLLVSVDNTNYLKGMIYNQISIAYECQNDYNKAIQNYQRALELMQDRNPLIAQEILASMGNCHLGRGQNHEALRYSTLSLNESQIIYQDNPNHPRIADCYINTGILNNKLGRYSEAIVNLHKAERMMKAFYSIESFNSNFFNLYNNLAVSHNNLGNIDISISYSYKALDQHQSMHEECVINCSAIAKIYNNLGLSYQKLERYTESINMFKEAIKYAQNDKNMLCIFYNNMAGTYAEIGQYETSLMLYKESLGIKQTLYDLSNTTFGKTFMGMGTLFRYQEDYSKSIAYYYRAYKIFVEAYGNNLQNSDIAGCNQGIKISWEAMNCWNSATLLCCIPCFYPVLIDNNYSDYVNNGVDMMHELGITLRETISEI